MCIKLFTVLFRGIDEECGAVERDRGRKWASVVKTYSSTSNTKSSSSANNRNRYLNISARKNESILGKKTKTV